MNLKKGSKRRKNNWEKEELKERKKKMEKTVKKEDRLEKDASQTDFCISV